MLAEQFNVTAKTMNLVLWNAKKLKQQFLTASGDLRCNREIKSRAMEEKVEAFISLLRNTHKPKPVSLSIVRKYAEQVTTPTMSMTLKNGWWQNLMKETA